MNNIKGPAIFLAQFVGEDAPFNSLDNICKWVSSLGYKGVQIPSWDSRLIDLKKASESKDYCDEIKGITKKHNLEITELSTHLQGQLVAVHPAYDTAFDGFAAPEVCFWISSNFRCCKSIKCCVVCWMYCNQLSLKVC